MLSTNPIEVYKKKHTQHWCEIFLYVFFFVYLSINQAAGIGAIIVPIFIIETIHELSSDVIGIGESGPINFGNVGEFHPNPMADESMYNVAIYFFGCVTNGWFK